MKLVTVNTRMVLATLKADPQFDVCSLANENKQLYQLQALAINPDGLQIELRPPGGRRSPIDLAGKWDLSFRDKHGAYQSPVKDIVERGDALVFHLQSYSFFLARRESIRLSVESRNPTRLHFHYKGEPLESFLVDFNKEGLGIQLNGERPFSVGDEIQSGEFQLRSHLVAFNKARIVHVAFAEKGLRVGLQFQDLTEDQENAIKQAFDAWHLSQAPAFASLGDG